MFSAAKRLGWMILPALLLVTGCGLKDQIRNFLEGSEGRKAVAKVGDREYTKADLERFFDSRLSEFRDPATTDQMKSSLLESFIEEKLLVHEAERHKVEANAQALKTLMEKIAAAAADRPDAGSSKPDAALRQSLAESLKIQQYVHDYLLKEVSVTVEECQAYYLAHLGDFVRNDVVRVREILVDDPAQAEKIQASLRARRNKNFADLARDYSKAPSASEGGDLGSFQRGDLPEDFEKAIFPLAPGAVSKIVRTQYGYHLFLVEEKIPAHQQKFYEVKEQIREKLQLERERRIIEQELASLLNKIPVQIHRERLGFNYVGTRLSKE